MKILICGLPSPDKTSFALKLSKELNCILYNGDETRSGLYPNLGFDEYSILEQARRMSFLCDIVLRTNEHVIADFICPTKRCRNIFGATHTIFMDTVKPNPDLVFEFPEKPDITINNVDQINDIPGILKLLNESQSQTKTLGTSQEQVGV